VTARTVYLSAVAHRERRYTQEVVVTEDESQIRELVAEIADAYHAKDAERIVRYNSPDIVTFSLAPPLQQRRGDTVDIGGRQVDMTTAEGVRTWFAGFGDAPFDYATQDLEVAADGNVAFAHCLARMGSPGAFSMWFRLTIGLHKSGEGWQITHTHASTPFYMDQTRRAALDLKP
jgi:ketosteroid isomerase-like protein